MHVMFACAFEVRTTFMAIIVEILTDIVIDGIVTQKRKFTAVELFILRVTQVVKSIVSN